MVALLGMAGVLVLILVIHKLQEMEAIMAEAAAVVQQAPVPRQALVPQASSLLPIRLSHQDQNQMPYGMDKRFNGNAVDLLMYP